MLPDWPITLRIPVQWGDMDALGHVNNVRYFRWFESARIACFDAIGLKADAPDGVGPILAQTTCDFRAPVTYPDEVVVGTRISRIGRTSFTMEYVVARVASPEEPVATGSAVVVTVDFGSGRPVPIPDPLRSAMAALGTGDTP